MNMTCVVEDKPPCMNKIGDREDELCELIARNAKPGEIIEALCALIDEANRRPPDTLFHRGSSLIAADKATFIVARLAYAVGFYNRQEWATPAQVVASIKHLAEKEFGLAL
jgi:hypothetical protein